MSARSRKLRQVDVEKSNISKKSSLLEQSHVSSVTENSKDSFATSHRNRSASPLNITRTDEKEELSHLNDRLAHYIDYVRQLERDKEILKKKILTFSEEKISYIDSNRKTYENEISSLRNLVDDLAKQKATADLEIKKHKEDSVEAHSKANRLNTEVRTLQRKIDSLERDVSLFKQDHDRYHKMKPDYDALEKKLELVRKDLDAETILRTHLENKVAGLREEIEFKTRVFDEERQKAVEKTVMIEEEIEDRKAAEFESRLMDELQAYRQQTADELQEYRTQMESSFQTKLLQLRDSNNDASDECCKLREEIIIARKQSDDFSHELAKKSGEVDLLKRRLEDLNMLFTKDRDDFISQLNYEREQVKRLQSEVEQGFLEFTDLMNTKIALDQEILMYRKMLEGEESRLNIQSPSRSSVFHIPRKKRRLAEDDGDSSSVDHISQLGSASHARYSFRVSTSATGNVEFTSEQDGQGRWVKLVNSTDEEVSIGNWVLKHQADGREITFKFHRSVTLKPKSTCTVWSSDSNATHNPPQDIVMKNQSFNSGGNIGIVLMNTDGEEQSTCSVVRERIRGSTPYTRPYVSRYGIGKSSEEKCSLM